MNPLQPISPRFVSPQVTDPPTTPLLDVTNLAAHRSLRANTERGLTTLPPDFARRVEQAREQPEEALPPPLQRSPQRDSRTLNEQDATIASSHTQMEDNFGLALPTAQPVFSSSTNEESNRVTSPR